MRDDTSNPPTLRPEHDKKKDPLDAYFERRARGVELLQEYAARRAETEEA